MFHFSFTYSFIFFVESVEFDSTLSYTLETMTPKNVHSGSVPQDVLDEENEWLRQLFRQENTLQKLFDTSENGMQQYKRTRIEASKDGVKAAKDALKIEGAKALLHPLLVGVDPTRCNQSVVEKNKFVHMLQTFRPHQTVLESGIGTGCTSGSTSRNKSVQRISAGKEVLAGEAMRAFRKVTRFSLERNKRAQISNGIDEEEACVEREVDDSDEVRLCHQEPGDDGSEGEIEVSDEFDVTDDHDNICSNNAQGGISGHVPRLSKAARRKQKANASDGSDAQMTFLDGSDSTNTVTQSGSSDRAESSYGSENRFHDTRHFMTYGTEDDKADFMESAMQPLSGMRGAELQGIFTPLIL